MILLTTNGDKIHCLKTTSPKMNKDLAYNWDSMKVIIDGKENQFFFHIKNSRSYFYFRKNEIWFKTKIVQDNGFDVWNYIETYRSFFYN